MTTITVYGSHSCHSSKKAIQWFNDHDIQIKTQFINQTPITREELIKFFSMSEDIYDIISPRSKLYKELSKTYDMNELSLNNFIALAIEHPSIVRKPIIFDGKQILVGFNEDSIRAFIPRSKRALMNQSNN